MRLMEKNGGKKHQLRKNYGADEPTPPIIVLACHAFADQTSGIYADHRRGGKSLEAGGRTVSDR
jgi:hypothetical protein